MKPQIIVVDFGSQYTQLIVRRVRENNVYAELVLPENLEKHLDNDNLKGIILSGSPFSVYDDRAPVVDTKQLAMQFPILGICYGAQLIAFQWGGTVERGDTREFGPSIISQFEKPDPFIQGISLPWKVWMSHSDAIKKLPEGFEVLAYTENKILSIFKHKDRTIYGVQFHPEVVHTEHGTQLLARFLFEVCGCEPTWTPAEFVQEQETIIRNLVGPQEQVVMAVSGGVDSSVAATIIHKAIGDRFHGFFVDTGLMRKGEPTEIMEAYKHVGLPVKLIDARSEFLSALKGVTEPEEKRRIIGHKFIEVFEREAKKIDGARWLGQGTIYPDVIESAASGSKADKIKSHHNVGGLPEKMNLKLIEPLRFLFKDEVRKIGEYLGLPDTILKRHPFPGPGLAIRIIGEITPEKVKLLQEADAIFIQMLKEHGLYDYVWQAGVILLPIKTVGVMGDSRTYQYAVALRTVLSTDGMTADWARLPHEFLAQVSNRIINEIDGINRVVYDITSKPPGTIEWE